MQDLRDHLSGKRSLGHYLLTPNGQTRIIAFDIDLIKADGIEKDGEIRNPLVAMEGFEPFDPRKIWRTDHPASPILTTHLQRVAVGLAIRTHKITGYPVAISFSGAKGLHVYGMPGHEVAANQAVEVAAMVMQSFDWQPRRGQNFWRHPDADCYPAVEVETFPKQGSLEGKDLGNLMRLPLGINRKSGQRSFFLEVGSPIDRLRELDATAALTGALPWMDENRD